MKRSIIFCIFSLILISNACKFSQPKPPYEIVQNAVEDSVMVVAEHPLAAMVGKEILLAGGNAVDAAIATQFALAVVYPRAGNIGGGGFMVIRLNDGTSDALDYREKAPAASFRDMYLDGEGNVLENVSKEGHLSVGVPGTVAGMELAFKKYSKLKDWGKILAPAIRLASKGFALTESEANRLNEYKEQFQKMNPDARPFVREEVWKMNDLLVQPDLAHTLELIRDKGAAGFYEGETADEIVGEMKRGGGLITLEDLKNYEAKWRTPIIGKYKNYRIITMPPPSSGGVVLMQILTMLEKFPLAEYGFQSAKSVHAIVEAERRAYADRAKHLGDADFYPVPVDSLMDSTYLVQKMSDFDSIKATSSGVLGPAVRIGVETFETTHTSIVDAEGNAVSVTTTLNLNYGSKVIVKGAGFFLNDEMDDFSAKPGVPNYFGLVGAEANAIQPGKRMLSSMTPTVVEKDGKLFMVLGAPGGSTIITAVLQTLLGVTDYGMTLDEAVWAPRFHHQWLPDVITCEEAAIDTTVRKQLWAMGHKLENVGRMALIKAVMVLPDGKLQGVGDNRNPDDHTCGY
ncbi:MAG: gamma-glutamyltransferase [Saprospiraceae bacterium]|nr:gamma-glutamyltransferase [Saprospiraceae bacterium]MCF8248854.1 gamma-glutamyltransferase [Saprospiraceae bacterium]MCF8279579.1 gamma-glutamyltransferase [Bacteroidales bacterium]MCF8310139.1 gamma-glutamyltransferase [Saprospiraceae bacterium]MCF8439039.1 gamma-glutamyltransferase [Saprospiraceae bacterium]